MMRIGRILIGSLFLLVLPLAAEIPGEVDLGSLPPGGEIFFTVRVENGSVEREQLSLISTCDCISPGIRALELDPGESGTVTFSFDGGDYAGEVLRYLVVSSSNALHHGERIRVIARVQERAESGTEEEADPCPSCERDYDEQAALKLVGEYESRALAVDFYADAGCRECERFLSNTLPKIRSSAERGLLLVKHDVMDPVVMDGLLARLEELGHAPREFPLLIGGGRVLQGLEEIEAGLPGLLREVEVAGHESRQAGGVDGFSAAAVLLAGLADGVNPCAFSTILFLVSMLALLGRSRTQILTVGIVFSLTVFLGYFLAGLGLFSAVRRLMIFPVVVRVIRWGLMAVLVVLAGLSLRDGLLARRGETSRMSLQLSRRMKQRIHGAVRNRLRTGSLVVGTAALGVLVTVFEFSCTGQVYLPVIMHLARNEADLGAYLLLAGYNAAFILPLLVVFGLSYAGVSQGVVGSFFSRRIALVKFLLAGVFALMAVMTILG